MVFVPGTVAVICPFRISNGYLLEFRWSTPAGWLLLFVGITIYSWCVWDFANFGRGTPIPIDAPKRLVVRGLYRYVRNPMYIGSLLSS
jgi:protein-S-isoprenylcysteine O-methyltransferase Ste14